MWYFVENYFCTFVHIFPVFLLDKHKYGLPLKHHAQTNKNPLVTKDFANYCIDKYIKGQSHENTFRQMLLQLL